jgi:hypothetical protein
MIVFIFFVWPLLVLWVLWVFFLAVMSLQSARDRGALTKWGLRIGYTVLIAGYVIDVLCQILSSVLFLELPPRKPSFPFFETTVSARVKRLIASGTGWRKSRAQWFRDHLLAPFDTSGRHG